MLDNDVGVLPDPLDVTGSGRRGIPTGRSVAFFGRDCKDDYVYLYESVNT